MRQQDVEFAVQEASDIVRPGCVAAFSTSELGGELEVREKSGRGVHQSLWSALA